MKSASLNRPSRNLLFPGGKAYTIVFGLVCIASGLVSVLSLGVLKPRWMSGFAGWVVRSNIESRKRRGV